MSYNNEKPNRFICIKIEDEGVFQKVSDVQNKILKVQPALLQCMKPKESLHVTLSVLRVNNETDEEKVKKILNELEPIIKKMVQGESRKIDFKGLGSFRYGNILFCQTKLPDVISKIRDLLCQKLKGDFNISHMSIPHMTILEIRYKHQRQNLSLSSTSYEKLINEDFGSYHVDNIHYCDIGDDRGSDGFYITRKKIEL